MKCTTKGGVKKTQQEEADEDRFFFREHLVEDAQNLLTDFPGLADPKFQRDLVNFLCEKAGIQSVHTVSLDEFAEARIYARAIIENTLPSIYRLCSSQEDSENKWPALRRAYILLIGILRHLKDNMEFHLNNGLREAINLTIHRRGDFGIELSEITRWLEGKYKIPLKRGRRPSRRELAPVALAMKTTNPNMSWMQIAQKLCRCGKAIHDYSCRENIRQAVYQLKRKQK